MRIRAISYARVSSDDQREAGTIELQRDYVPRWSEREGVEVVRAYEDDGVSGTIMLPERPGGAQLLRDLPELRAQGVSLVLLYNWSRLGREPWVVWGAIYDLEKRGGLRIRSVTEEADTSTPERVLMLCVGTGVASMERARFLKVSRDASNMLAARGTWLGGTPPYGYRVEGRGREARLVTDETPFAEVDPAFGLTPAAVVQRIYEWAAEGATLSRICERLNALGVPSSFRKESASKTGGNAHRWYPARLRGLLINPAYRGEHQYGRRSHGLGTRPREIISRAVPPLVDEALWQQAQDTLKRNLRRSGRNTKGLYLFRGLLRCGLCGCSYVGATVNTSTGPTRYYRCSRISVVGLPDERRCDSGMANADKLEPLLWQRVEDLARQPEQVRVLLTRGRDRESGAQERVREQLRHLQAALTERDTQRERIITLARRGLINERDLARELGKLDREEEALRQEIVSREREARQADYNEEQIQRAELLFARLAPRLASLAWEERREWLETVVEEVVLTITGPRYHRELDYEIRWRLG